MKDFKKVTEKMEVIKVRLDKYQNDFINDSNNSSFVSAAVPSLGNPNHNEAQKNVGVYAAGFYQAERSC